MADDPRQIRTRQALKAALLRLAADDAVTSVSVAQLCNEAGVHRTTFYGHANSLEEFAVDVLAEDIDVITTVEVDTADAINAYRQATVALMDHLRSKRPVLRPLFASPWKGALLAKLEEDLHHRAQLAVETLAGMDGVDVPKPYAEASAFIAGALLGTCLDWVNSDDEDSEGRASRMLALFPAWWPVR
ncbi:TetR/AcrR family transcriptional regulator [Galactobacter sp.]|uniref:TetR/AcrR family transcriptional regulator n=1 Tax=Galactobacter sp. TaxID=2676125 RepID=UPI0025BDE98E|nr:TetR/AcrR family transcriptional regulator [Galactobacter sp.]